MGKTVFMFPGQGSQYIGMGKEFYEQIPICKEVYDLASEVTGLDIPALCFEENEKLNITEYTQICMLATEAAIYMALEQNGYQPDVTAGLSLGEYGALIASGIFAHIALQVTLNIAVVTGLMPTTGVTLPFISYGGTAIVILLAEMGIALGISSKIRLK